MILSVRRAFLILTLGVLTMALVAPVAAARPHPPAVVQIPLEGNPNGLAVDNGAVWVGNIDTNTVSRIDPNTNSVIAKIGPFPDRGATVAAGDGMVWVAAGGNTVARIDPTTNAVTATIDIGRVPSEIAVGGGAVFTSSGGDGVVTRIDPTTNTVTWAVPAFSAGSIRVGAGGVWTDNLTDTVTRLDPLTGNRVATIRVPGVNGCVIGAGGVWAETRRNLVRIDPTTNSVSSRVQLTGNAPLYAAGDDTAVWTSSSHPQALFEIKAGARRARKFSAPVDISELAIDATGLWAISFDAGGVARIDTSKS
jgi:YVTN family beta-propeller protein